MSSVAVLRWIATGFIGVIRGTPLIAQIFVLYFGISAVILLAAFWAGAIALAIHNAAYIAEIIRSGFQSVPKGLDEASRSLGMSRMKTLRRVRAPLALRAILPVLGSQFIIAVKDSSLVSFIGMTELFQTSRNLAASTYQPLTMYLIVSLYYLAIVLALTFLVNRLEYRLSAHRR
jgi:polar amino acid transport system permease protein